MLDVIYGEALRPYNDCNITPCDLIPKPEDFHFMLPCIETLYGSTAHLGFLFKDGTLHSVGGAIGAQQGCPLAAAMYSGGQHPVLVRVAECQEAVFLLTNADNFLTVA